jgi:cytoskeletal protein RodZ
MTDRLSDEDLPIIQDLGAWLRRERERAGVTLETIAARTKVARTLLEALERNDVSRWPNGIFRRAFIRGYASQIGLDPDYAVALFIRAFDGRTPPRRSWIEPARASPAPCRPAGPSRRSG